MVWACDEKIVALRRKDGDGRRRKRGRPKSRWLDRVRDDIKEKGFSGGGGGGGTTVLHGCVGRRHRRSTPDKSGNKVKRKKKVSNIGLAL